MYVSMCKPDDADFPSGVQGLADFMLELDAKVRAMKVCLCVCVCVCVKLIAFELAGEDATEGKPPF